MPGSEFVDQRTEDRAVIFNGLVEVHRILEEEVFRLQRRHRQSEISTIILGTVLSGGLWIMLNTAVPTVTAWSGAVASTFLTAFAAIRYFLNDPAKIRALEELYEEVGSIISAMRAQPTQPVSEAVPYRFLDEYKGFEARMVRLGVKPPRLWREAREKVGPHPG